MAVYSDILGTLRSYFRIGPIAKQATWDVSGLTAPRTFAFPDKAGTLALLSDVSTGGATVDGGSASTVFTAPFFRIDFGAAS